MKKVISHLSLSRCIIETNILPPFLNSCGSILAHDFNHGFLDLKNLTMIEDHHENYISKLVESVVCDLKVSKIKMRNYKGMQTLQTVMTTKRSYLYSFFYIYFAGPFRSGKSNNVVLINKKRSP